MRSQSKRLDAIKQKVEPPSIRVFIVDDDNGTIKDTVTGEVMTLAAYEASRREDSENIVIRVRYDAHLTGRDAYR